MTTTTAAETADLTGAKPGRWRRHPDIVAVTVLVVVVALAFVVPAALGHPAVAGDNLIQNFPLRALSGSLMRQGHLPLWNPFIWSGSPLLGGLNAGSFYPLTFLFVVLPPIGAWVANMVGTYLAAALGLYALGRQYRLHPLACFLGALTYAFAGAMSGQMVHLGVVEGFGWVPLLVLAQLRLSWSVFGSGPTTAGSVATRRSAPWRWVALLAVVIGLEALTGEPRAMAETEVVAGAVTLWLVLRPYAPVVDLRRRLKFLWLSAVAGLWGVALAAAELAPGWSFITSSQRAVESYWFFGSGSLNLRWSALLFVPDLFGGAGRFLQPTFFNHYNLPEVTGYVGLLPLGAALVLLSRSFGRRRHPSSADWGMWLGLLVFGLFLTWGSYTPLGHLWYLIPLFGKTRLQSRNLGIVDLALCVLVVFWADLALRGRLAAAGLAGWRRWVTSTPAIVSAGLAVGVLVAPVAVLEWFGTSSTGAYLGDYMVPWMVAQAVVATVAVALVFGWRRLSPPARRRLLSAFVVVDVTLFVLATATGYNPVGATLEPTTAHAQAVLGTTGRFAIYDTGVSGMTTLSTIGQPDLNAFTQVPSVQGYGSILSDTYGTTTGTHELDTLTPCALEIGVFTPLRLSTVLIAAKSLGPGIDAGGPPPPQPACHGAPAPGTADQRILYLGSPIRMTGADLHLVRHATVTGTLRVGVLGEKGGQTFPAATVDRTAKGWTVRFAHPMVGYGLVLDGPARAVSETSTVTGTQLATATPATTPTSTIGRWSFDGAMQAAVSTGGWHYQGIWDHFAVFTRSVGPPVWVSGSPSGGHVTQVSTTEWGTEVDRVVATHAVTVVRSEAYLAGWHAVAAPAGGGPDLDLPVMAHGLVQSVRVPAGRWTITFRYRPPHLTLGLVGSAAALAALCASGVVALVARRRVQPR